MYYVDMQNCLLYIKEGATPKYVYIPAWCGPSITTVSKAIHLFELLLGWILLVATSSYQQQDVQPIKLIYINFYWIVSGFYMHARGRKLTGSQEKIPTLFSIYNNQDTEKVRASYLLILLCITALWDYSRSWWSFFCEASVAYFFGLVQTDYLCCTEYNIQCVPSC